MAKGDHGYRRELKGSKHGGYRRPRVQIGFDKDTIAIILRVAKANNRSYAAQVRELVSIGLRFVDMPVDLTKVVGGPEGFRNPSLREAEPRSADGTGSHGDQLGI